MTDLNPYSASLKSPSFEGKIHHFTSRLAAFEFSPTKTPNTLIFIGGLTDGLLTVPYVPYLASQLPSNWSLCQTLISSSYNGWGTGSLKRDAAEIGELVKYLRVNCNKEKIVIMGHSTGTQDVIQYITKFLQSLDNDVELYNVDGGILQAPASDREAISMSLSSQETEEAISEVQAFVKENSNDDSILLPDKYAKIWFGTPITAYRFLALTAPCGDDDFFTSDLLDLPHDHPNSPAQTFGKVNRPLLILPSGDDEFVAKSIDQGERMERWQSFMDAKFKSKYSGVLEGAKHAVGPDSKEGAQDEVAKRVVGFLSELI
ncbi:hypothetical protein DASC09_049980 [Saccharomycopsis crataegensis]|uniref:Uncharacterized protein n=1 Tax=Saccharomycopsis crataegensis TaxID=43959 RepID=A0AAV5QS80_9ASCO|nr:hypothetical protein DASC09_049980 [Saccharomycopsis crataegensis]